MNMVKIQGLEHHRPTSVLEVRRWIHPVLNPSMGNAKSRHTRSIARGRHVTKTFKSYTPMIPLLT